MSLLYEPITYKGVDRWLLSKPICPPRKNTRNNDLNCNKLSLSVP